MNYQSHVRIGYAKPIFIILSLIFTQTISAQPNGFVDQQFLTGFDQIVGFTWDDAGNNLYVWEKNGKVKVVQNGVTLPTPLLDIEEEVGGWRDFGLLGFALDPNFLVNGYFYIHYLVDRHYLLNFGTPSYDPNTNEYFDASIGRVTRYQADAATGFTTLVPNSRFILLGETKETGEPHLHESHGIGQIVFGTDGTLMVAMGDGASYSSTDEGSASETYWQQALTDGIITPAENIGAYRCQLPSSLNGKILRIDPVTGDGIPSNPFYDSNNPRSAESRTWSLGVRNPYRMTKRPNTGSHDPADADPGTFYFGDVGWGLWEDLNVIDAPGQNFGWPKYEGITHMPGYNNPTYEPATHERPKIDFRHGQDIARGIVNGQQVTVGSALLPGNQFRGNASTGGIWYTGTDFPLEYQNTYFHADYSSGWIRNFAFDGINNPLEVNEFQNSAGPVVYLNTHPTTGSLYYVRYPNQIRKISYTGVFNSPPTASASADILNGASPLTVNFTGDQSFDPDFDNLTYSWDFGNGNFSSDANPTHTFSNGNIVGYTVTLTVSDGQFSDQATLNISLNNTAPVIISTSIDGVSDFSVTNATNLSLSASVADAEHTNGQLTYQWDVELHHNDHFHSESSVNSPTTVTTLTPVGCNGATYWYRIRLTVTDPVGASAVYEKDLFPNCTGNSQTITFPPVTDKFINDAPFALNATTTSGLPITYYVKEGPAVVTGNTINLTGIPGVVTVVATQHGNTTFAVAIPKERSFNVSVPSGGVCSGSGTISREVWTGITGTAVNQIPVNTTPDIEDELTIFEIPVNVLDNYGTRLRGYICAPTTGQYTFWIASDDNGELWLSTNADPTNKTLIANVPQWTNSQEWDKFPEQMSAPITLIGGQTYYIEALAKEQSGGDNLAVGWQLPSGTLERPIPGSRLSPFNGQSPIAAFTANPLTGNAPFFVNFNGSTSSDPDGTITNYDWDFGNGSSASGVNVSHTYNNVGDYTVVLTVTDNDGNTAQNSTIISVTQNNQPTFITFSDETNLLSNTDFNSGVAMGVVDMNGDGKDDIVRLDNARNLNFEYQNAPNQAFTNFNFGNVSASNQWSLAIGDADENGYNDLITGGSYDDIKLLTANANGTNYSQTDLPNSDDIFIQGSNFVDINNDGDLDIFACHDDAESQKWEGDGNGNFTFNNSLIPTITVPSSDNSGNYASIWTDYDNDGDLDLYVSKCRLGVNSSTDPRRVNQLFQNDGNGNYTEVAQQANLKIGAQSWATDFADIDNDGDLDAFIINHDVTSQLMENNGNGTFTDITTGSGMIPDLSLFGIQALFRDFDNDGFVDLVISGDEQRLFKNNGDKTFTRITDPFNNNAMESLAVGDLNQDGFLDIYAGYANLFNSPTNIDDRIFMNQANGNNWFSAFCVGTVSNINGIGARVELHGSWGVQIREVRSGEGYGIQNSFNQHFGIGSANAIQKVVVKWPSGIVNEILNPSINQFLTITETPPTGGDIDLELSMSTSNNEPAQWSNFTVTASLTNAGNDPATGVEVSFPLPDGVVFVGGNAANASQGTYDAFNSQSWTVGTLAAGETATLELNFFLLTTDPVTSYAEVTAANETDTDSTPNNGSCCTANEDDEGVLTVPMVGPQNQTIIFPSIPNKESDDQPFQISATASSGLSVSYTLISGPATLSGNTVTLTGALGTVVIEATQGGNAMWNPAPPVQRSFQVTQPGLMDQTIAFSPIPNKQTDAPPFQIFATASSGLPVTFTHVSGPATVSGNTVTLTGTTGTVTIRASQSGNAQFNPAPDVEQSFNVTLPAGEGDIDLALSFTTSNATPSQWSNFTITATLTNDGPMTATNVEVSLPTPNGVVYQGGNEFTASTGSFSTNGNQVWTVGNVAANATETIELNYFLLTADPVTSYGQVTNAPEIDADSTPDNGTCCVSNEDDEAALTVPNVGPQNQTINFPAIADKESDDQPFDISATATSGLPVSFAIESGPATISGNTITLNGTTGSVTIRASQAGNANFNPAPDVLRTFQVNTPGLMNQTINFPAIPNKMDTDPPFNISAAATSGLPVGFVIESGPATISGNTITLNGNTGTVVVRASQGGDATYNPAPDVTQSFTVSGPVGNDEIDLELSVSASNNTIQIWNNVTFTLTITNNGNVAANNIEIAAPILTGLAYTSSSASAGSYNLFTQNWDLPSLAVGATETLDLVLFNLQDSNPVDFYVQVVAADETDSDSTPDNNTGPTPSEDDEALTIVNPPSSALLSDNHDIFTMRATRKGSSVQIRWFCNMGFDADQYILERSADAIHFEELKIRPNEEFNDNVATYRELDFHPNTGANYYRIKLILNDGREEFTNIQLIDFEDGAQRFLLFPNPNDGEFKIDLKSVAGKEVVLKVFDRNGIQVWQEMVEEASVYPHKMEVEGLRNGTFFLWIQVEGRRPVVREFFVGR